MKLVLLRHGMTEANERRLYCGASDLPLCVRGREELLRLKAGRDLSAYAGFEKITSGMRRTDETLMILMDAEADQKLPALREMDFGSFELHSYEELRGRSDYQEWIGDPSGDVPTPGGESSNAFCGRVLAAAQRLNRDALIICHGGVIAALMAHWFPEEGLNMYQWQPDFGCGYVVETGSGGRLYTKI